MLLTVAVSRLLCSGMTCFYLGLDGHSGLGSFKPDFISMVLLVVAGL